MRWLWTWLGKFNPNGSGIWGCTCCGCHDGCDEYCHRKEDRCRIHGTVFPRAHALESITAKRCCKTGCEAPLSDELNPFCDEHMKDPELIKAWNEL